MQKKFKDYEYRRPDFEKLKNEMNALISSFENAVSADDQYEIVLKINKLRNSYGTMASIANIRYTINTKDKFYSDEHDHFDDIAPEHVALMKKFRNAVLNTKFRKELESKTGIYLFKLYEISQKTFNDEIKDDLRTESKLVTEYIKLIANAKIFYEGKERNLADMSKFMESENREVRKALLKPNGNFLKTMKKSLTGYMMNL